MAKPLPWSHSSLSQFETCGRQYEELKVLRNFQDQKNPASLWGDEVHKAFEKWIEAMLEWMAIEGVEPPRPELPANMVHYEPYLRQFIERPGRTFAEREYALDRNLKPCAFLGPDCWARGIIDVLTLDGNVAWVDDHKTGKNRKKDMQQLIIFALLVFYHHPEIDTIHTTFHWLQLNAKDSETFTRAQIPALWETLVPKLERYAKAFHIGIFHPKQSGLCRKHCAVSTCEFYGESK